MRKLVTRHTHIFGDTKATNPEEALRAWEAAKAVEKSASSLTEQLARIPETFPALLKAQKSLKKMFKDGLINDSDEASASDLLITLGGAMKSGTDAEVDLMKALRSVTEGYLKGEITKLSDIKSEKAIKD